MERRRLLKYLASAGTLGAVQILSFNKGEGLKTGHLQPHIGISEANAMCGNGVGCSGSSGSVGMCGTSANCAGGYGQCGAGLNCSGS